MKILQICKKIPYPTKDGETIAIWNLTKGLSDAGHGVTVLAITTPKHNLDLAELPENVQAVAQFDTVFVNTSVSVFEAVANLFTNQSYNIYRFVSAKFKRKIADYLQQNTYDIIQLEGVYLAPYCSTIRKYTDAPIVMRAHNIEFEIWERLANEQQNWLKKMYMQLLAKRLKRFETTKLSEYDALVPISVKDEAYFKAYGFSKPILTIPASVNLLDYPENQTIANFPSVFFIGSLDWMPNQEGLLWLIEHVWPKVLKQHPQLILQVAGRNAPDWLENKDLENVNFVGEVDSAVEFMQSNGVMLVPLFSGSGMRVKIIEAMALGKAIIATSIAAEGIACTHQQNILLADTANAFADCLLQLLSDQMACEQIGQQARQFVEQQHNTKQLVDNLVEFYNFVGKKEDSLK